MSMEAQRVLVIQDASREVCSSAIRWALHGLSLKPGDKLTLLGVLHQVNSPSTLSFIGGRKPLGYKGRVDASSMFGVNQRIVDKEVERKKEEYQNNMEIIQISKLNETQKVEFKLEVASGPSPKVVALKAAENLRATWVILDRQMKKDKKYFLEKLSCGISRMKRNNSIEQLRGPKTTEINKLPTGKSRASQVTYNEMMPGSLEEEDLFSIELFPTSQGNTEVSSSSLGEAKCTHFDSQEEKNSTKTQRETLGKKSTIEIFDYREIGQTEANQMSQDQELSQSRGTEDLMEGWRAEEMFETSLCSICKNRRPKIVRKRDFTYAELQAATDGFSAKNFLSEGRFGSVFKGQLKNKLKIAVKQHNDASSQGEKEYKSGVHELSKSRHSNVIMLLGSCSEGSHRLLVYEYACNGSLNQHLSKYSPTPLTWTERIKIALGASRGLNYLHQNNIIHSNMRSKKILLTHDYEPLLGDFGPARTQYKSDQSSEHGFVRTCGYLAQEYAGSEKMSTNTDVYSFGVVLLELITGRSTTDRTLGEKSLVGWARPLLKERKYKELIDPRIVNSHDVHQLFWMVRVAEECLSKDPKKRLSMDKVVFALEYITESNTCYVVEDFSPLTSYSVISMSESNDSQSYERTTEHESFSTEEKSDSITGQMSGYFSESSATISTRSTSTITSLGKPSSGSEESYKMIGAKSRRRIQVHYGEMLN